jgi:hypothetical protein
MSHWAEIDETKTVIRVLVGHDHDLDEGYQWLLDNLGGTWIKTSYNGNIRKNYAGIGHIYDEARDAFIAPKPNDFTDEEGNSFTFILNEETCQWETLLLG